MVEIMPAIGQGLAPLFDSLGGFLGFLFSDKSVATKTLFSVLLFLVLYTVVDITFRKKWYFTVLVTGAVTALAIIAIPDAFLTSLLSGYGALGSAVLMIIPFVILTVFTFRIKSSLAGRAAWVFYVIYYFAFVAYDTFTKSAPLFSAENIPQFGAIIAGVLMFFFTSSIRHAIFKGELKEIKLEGEEIALQAGTLHRLQKEELKSYSDKTTS